MNLKWRDQNSVFAKKFRNLIVIRKKKQKKEHMYTHCTKSSYYITIIIILKLLIKLIIILKAKTCRGTQIWIEELLEDIASLACFDVHWSFISFIMNEFLIVWFLKKGKKKKTGKVFDSWIRDVKFNFRLHQKHCNIRERFTTKYLCAINI